MQKIQSLPHCGVYPGTTVSPMTDVTLAGKLHHGRRLVTEDRWEEPSRISSAEGVDVRVAQSVAQDLDADLPAFGARPQSPPRAGRS